MSEISGWMPFVYGILDEGSAEGCTGATDGFGLDRVTVPHDAGQTAHGGCALLGFSDVMECAENRPALMALFFAGEGVIQNLNCVIKITQFVMDDDFQARTTIGVPDEIIRRIGRPTSLAHRLLEAILTAV